MKENGTWREVKSDRKIERELKTDKKRTRMIKEEIGSKSLGEEERQREMKREISEK